MTKVYVFLASGFEEIEAITIIDVLRRAEIDTTTVSITERKEVTGTHHITITADTLFDQCTFDENSMLVLPGGQPGTNNLKDHAALGKLIRQYYADGKPLGAICAAPSVLGKYGLLEGKNAVCYPGFEKELTGANVVFEPALVDGQIITGRGVGAALHFALEIVKKLKGKELADQLAKQMLVQNW